MTRFAEGRRIVALASSQGHHGLPLPRRRVIAICYCHCHCHLLSQVTLRDVQPARSRPGPPLRAPREPPQPGHVAAQLAEDRGRRVPVGDGPGMDHPRLWLDERVAPLLPGGRQQQQAAAGSRRQQEAAGGSRRQHHQ